MLSENLSSTAQPRREHRHQRHGHLRSIPPCPHRNTRAPGPATRQSLRLTDNVVSIGPYPQLASATTACSSSEANRWHQGHTAQRDLACGYYAHPPARRQQSLPACGNLRARFLTGRCCVRTRKMKRHYSRSRILFQTSNPVFLLTDRNRAISILFWHVTPRFPDAGRGFARLMRIATSRASMV